jgi:hypothetical protein
MGIPTSVLKRWKQEGPVQTSSDTLGVINRALDSDRSALNQFEHSYKVHLQGSYKNTTNTINSEADVDVVVKCTRPWSRDLEDLSPAEEERYEDWVTSVDYDSRDFRDDVLTSLTRYFKRGNVTNDDKAIKVDSEGTPLPRKADVVPCLQYRVYHSFPNPDDAEFTEGMWFKPRKVDRVIINYSLEHYEQGVDKMDATNKNYKETVRMFKKARDFAVDRGHLKEDVASSYFLECFLYNVDDDLFSESLRDRYESILEWFEIADFSTFTEQSEMRPLFDSADPDKWDKQSAEETITGLNELWEEW